MYIHIYIYISVEFGTQVEMRVCLIIETGPRSGEIPDAAIYHRANISYYVYLSSIECL